MSNLDHPELEEELRAKRDKTLQQIKISDELKEMIRRKREGSRTMNMKMFADLLKAEHAEDCPVRRNGGECTCKSDGGGDHGEAGNQDV